MADSNGQRAFLYIETQSTESPYHCLRSIPDMTHNFGANVVRALHVVRARADVVATKLGIIPSFFFLFCLGS